MFHLLTGLLIFLYLAWRLAWPLRKHPAYAGTVLMLIGGGAFKYPLTRLLGGPYFFAPDLPGWALLFAGFWFGWVYFLLIFLLLMEPLRLFRKQFSPRRIHLLHLIAAAAAAMLAGLSLYGGIRAPEVRKITLVFPDLPQSADGLRLAILSDLHANPTVPRSRVAEFVRLADAEHPDAILLTGDFMDGLPEKTAKDLAPLAGLHARLGVWGIPGNHDYFYGYAAWRKILAGYGIRMLENESADLAGLRLAGITDPAAKRFHEAGPDLDRALQNAQGKFTILLAHRPGIAPEAAKHGVKLQFSGHTHGGMLPVLKWIVAGFNQGFVSGRYRVGGMTLLVSNGTGIWNGLPLRLGSPAEILIVTLRAK